MREATYNSAFLANARSKCPFQMSFLHMREATCEFLMAQFFCFFVKALSPELGHPPAWSVEPQTLTKEHHTQTKPNKIRAWEA
jgi:hypothetical protein